MQLLTTKAKPFLKWAGGKAQLMEQLLQHLPPEIKLGKVHRYVEPFVGSGALFFHIAQIFEIEVFYNSDVNEQLLLKGQVQS